ncbi:MAG: hypothetical protein ABR581_01020 [Thermoleophilaceae bacterium]
MAVRRAAPRGHRLQVDTRPGHDRIERSRIIGRARRPDGREVVITAGSWRHVPDEHEEMAAHSAQSSPRSSGRT